MAPENINSGYRPRFRPTPGAIKPAETKPSSTPEQGKKPVAELPATHQPQALPIHPPVHPKNIKAVAPAKKTQNSENKEETLNANSKDDKVYQDLLKYFSDLKQYDIPSMMDYGKFLLLERHLAHERWAEANPLVDDLKKMPTLSLYHQDKINFYQAQIAFKLGHLETAFALISNWLNTTGKIQEENSLQVRVIVVNRDYLKAISMQQQTGIATERLQKSDPAAANFTGQNILKLTESYETTMGPPNPAIQHVRLVVPQWNKAKFQAAIKSLVDKFVEKNPKTAKFLESFDK